jgi:hypothetical protein
MVPVSPESWEAQLLVDCDRMHVRCHVVLFDFAQGAPAPMAAAPAT